MLANELDSERIKIILARRRLLGAGVLALIAVAVLPVIFYSQSSSEKPVQLVIHNLFKPVPERVSTVHPDNVLFYRNHIVSEDDSLKKAIKYSPPFVQRHDLPSFSSNKTGSLSHHTVTQHPSSTKENNPKEDVSLSAHHSGRDSRETKKRNKDQVHHLFLFQNGLFVSQKKLPRTHRTLHVSHSHALPRKELSSKAQANEKSLHLIHNHFYDRRNNAGEKKTAPYDSHVLRSHALPRQELSSKAQVNEKSLHLIHNDFSNKRDDAGEKKIASYERIDLSN